ncbi:MAG: hypothetical protein ACOCXP_01595 [Candidatus Dojkabacteria bacterium]
MNKNSVLQKLNISLASLALVFSFGTGTINADAAAPTGGSSVIEECTTIVGPYGGVTETCEGVEVAALNTGFGDDPITIASAVFAIGIGLLIARQYAANSLS